MTDCEILFVGEYVEAARMLANASISERRQHKIYISNGKELEIVYSIEKDRKNGSVIVVNPEKGYVLYIDSKGYCKMSRVKNPKHKDGLGILMLGALAKLGIVSLKSLFIVFYKNLDRITAHRYAVLAKRGYDLIN